ncbi:MoaD/ThiS family protein [Kineosporia rhizophila]|uniref:MoaD/ThiS family protein n=1 Tax=Kineosporia TaxID=49184 RepID=UPI001E37034B|nr:MULTISPECIES: MoaD/ThiS family protein [Kineosporia]MCE0535881.1 MoaD/ThiS family protein [Kineosporia rhizophila]GLY14291.1 molybdopterin synthase sulfur carrier subunit [Kineosporia sp. NBRC 101677]
MSNTITIRYFAGARRAAGVESEALTASAPLVLEDVVGRLAERHGNDLARVLDASSFLIDEVAGDRSRLVPVGAVVDVLPPFAGG